MTGKYDPLVGDGVGKYLGTCKLCGRKDLIFPINGLICLCPNCVKKTALDLSDVKIISSGICDICGVHFVGAGVQVKSGVMACFKCLWIKLGKKNCALRPNGRRII